MRPIRKAIVGPRGKFFDSQTAEAPRRETRLDSADACCVDRLNPPCEPRSEWWISPGCERFAHTAALSAWLTNAVVIRASIACPTTSQVNKSLMPARYSQPSAVGTYVMSVTQVSFGRVAAKVCTNTLSATGSVCVESVVVVNRRTC